MESPVPGLYNWLGDCKTVGEDASDPFPVRALSSNFPFASIKIDFACTKFTDRKAWYECILVNKLRAVLEVKEEVCGWLWNF